MINSVSIVRPVGAAGAAENTTAATAVGGGADFGKVMADVATNAAQALKTGEATAISGITGGASTQQVVESVMHAEQQLHTVLAIRDKLVSAYQEISRMQI